MDGSGFECRASARRTFLERLAIGAGAVAAATLARATPVAALGSVRVRRQTGPWSDAWLQRLTGKHRQFFDAVTPNDGFALAFTANFLNLNHEAYGLTDKDLTAVIGLRHVAMPLALPDNLWARYNIGEELQFKDPATGGPATRNPYLHADGAPRPGSDIPALVDRGVVFTVCNVALTTLSGQFAKNAGVSKEEAKADWSSHLLPGMTLVPVGVMAGNLAQEHGCTYCYGG